MSDDATGAHEEQLLQRVRAGDPDAFQELYDDHLEGARQLARILVGRDGADELVSESFARVLSALSGGGGPTSNFRAYLHVTIRNGYRDSFRTTQESPVSDQPWLLDEPVPTVEEMVDGLDETVATDALTTLPERWQQVLWHVEVEGRKPAEVAELMDLSPRTVSSLAHRAREGLKQAYLDLHAGPEPTAEECQWVHARMSKSARGELSVRAQRKLDLHLEECDDCAAAFLVVGTLNQRLAAYVLPLVLLGAVPASGKVAVWLAAAAGGTAVAGGAAGASTAGGAGGAGGGGSAGSSTGGPAVAVAVAAAVVAAVAGGSWALVAKLNNGKPAAANAPVVTAAAGDPGSSGARPKPAPRHQASRTSTALPSTTPTTTPTTAATAAPTTVPTSAPVRHTKPPTSPTSAPPTSPTSATPTTPTTTPTSPSTTPASACGTDVVCTVLQGVTQVVQSLGMRLVANIDTNGGADRAITLTYRFSYPVEVATSPAEWSCTSGRVKQATCTFRYVGAQPPALTLDLTSSGSPSQPLSGTVTMQSGNDTSTSSFSG